ncbi:MAG: glycosyltransferase [Methanosarcinaceae archaeon]|nr:glycosyltransferase [Methanosarcinaceae archaeon]
MASTLGIYSLISEPVTLNPFISYSEGLLRHEVTVIIPAKNEELSIASKVLLASEYADRVLVLDGGSTDRTFDLASMAGAGVLPSGEGQDALLKALFRASKDSDIVVLVHPACLRDFDILSQELSFLKSGECDISVGSWPQRFSDALENIYLFNGKAPVNEKIGFLAIFSESLSKLGPGPQHLSVREFLSYAEAQGLRVKKTSYDSELFFNKFYSCRIGVVVPAYNEEALIRDTLRGIPAYVDRIYVVEDGSSDRTSELIDGVSDPRIVHIRHEVNKGVGCSIIDGYKLALKDEMDVVAVMAGDNQMDPAQLPRLLIPVIEGRADYSKGNRLLTAKFMKGMSRWRAFGNFLLSLLTKVGSGYWQLLDPQNGYTVISRRALEAMDLDSVYPYYGYCNDLLIKLNAFGMKVEDVVMPARYGDEKSSIRYGKYILKVSPMLFRGFLWRLRVKYMVLDFHPLALFYITGMVLLPASVFFGVFLLLVAVFSNPFPAYYTVLDLFAMFMGVQMLLFGMFFDMQADRSRRIKK